MAVAYGDIGTTNQSASSTDYDLAIPLPSTFSSGDMLVALIATEDSGWTWSPPGGDGWSTIINNPPANYYCAAFYKIAGETENDPKTFTCTETSGPSARGVIIALTGCDADSYDTHVTTSEPSFNTSIPFDDIVVADNDSLIVWFASCVTTYTRTVTSDRGTERLDESGGPTGFPIWLYTEDISSSGTITGAEFTLNSSRQEKSSLSISFSPAASGISIPIAMHHYRNLD